VSKAECAFLSTPAAGDRAASAPVPINDDVESFTDADDPYRPSQSRKQGHADIDEQGRAR